MSIMQDKYKTNILEMNHKTYLRLYMYQVLFLICYFQTFLHIEGAA